MEKTPITLREIISDAINSTDKPTKKHDEKVDECIQKIKQKFAHLRRVFFNEIEIKRLTQELQPVPGNETFSLLKPLSTDEILDIIYSEIDHLIEGLEDKEKNLVDLSHKEGNKE